MMNRDAWKSSLVPWEPQRKFSGKYLQQAPDLQTASTSNVLKAAAFNIPALLRPCPCIENSVVRIPQMTELLTETSASSQNGRLLKKNKLRLIATRCD